MTDIERHRLTNGAITVEVKAVGAELCSLRRQGGPELLWEAASVWPRHAPILFPIVGRLKDDQLRIRDQSFRMTQHGFARDRRFAWETREPAACCLALTDDAESRAIYPFAFRLEIAYALKDDRLDARFIVTNSGEGTLPASIGAHPAFRWPLAEGLDQSAHQLEFARGEPGPIRRLRDGLLRERPEPTPIDGRVLKLTKALFDDDAIILPHPASRSVRYTTPGVPGIEVGWDDGFPQLGVWSKPGGDFLCIEPWHGFASPETFDGPFPDKPGLMLIPPGERREMRWGVRLP